MGDADTYDPDLEAALNLFMNKATLFWFPSAEGSYGDAVDHLKNFVTKLKPANAALLPQGQPGFPACGLSRPAGQCQ